MDELIAFVKARLDDDEDAARGVPQGPWHVSAGAEKGYPQSILNSANILVAQTFTGPEVPPMEADYIARHDPARVLREVAAKRAVVRRYQDAIDGAEDTVSVLYLTVSDLAGCWSDHPDYRQEWKP